MFERCASSLTLAAHASKEDMEHLMSIRLSEVIVEAVHICDSVDKNVMKMAFKRINDHDKKEADECK